MQTAPIAMAPASERPPIMVSAGYFSSSRAPSFQSSHETVATSITLGCKARPVKRAIHPFVRECAMPHTAVLIVAVIGAMLAPAQNTASPDAEGFIRDWLVLAPLAIEGESGADQIDKDFIAGEGAAKPKAGDKATVGANALTWTPYTSPDYFIDFLTGFGKTRGEYVAAYAGTYVVAEEDMKVTLALSSNDQGKAWLNGQQVFRFADTR